jgi:hypothetical protein
MKENRLGFRFPIETAALLDISIYIYIEVYIYISIYIYSIYIHIYLYIAAVSICIYIYLENGTNVKRKWQTSVCFLQTENRKQKFVFLNRKTKSSNRHLLFQQTCLSMTISIIPFTIQYLLRITTVLGLT